MQAIAALGIPAPERTPLVQMGALWIKSEATQCTGSAKYRMVASKVERAIRSGAISDGATLAEVTSGSTGVALAYVGKLLALPVELHAYESITPAKKKAIEELGARLVLHPMTTPVSDLLDLVYRKRVSGTFWHLDQYDRRSIVDAYKPLGQELAEQIRRLDALPPRVFLCPVGTGGLIQGVGQVLRTAFPGIRVIGVEPAAGSMIDGTRNTELFHQGPSDPYDRTFPDETVRVAAPEQTVALSELRLGESSTAAFQVAAAREWGSTIILAPD